MTKPYTVADASAEYLLSMKGEDLYKFAFGDNLDLRLTHFRYSGFFWRWPELDQLFRHLGKFDMGLYAVEPIATYGQECMLRDDLMERALSDPVHERQLDELAEFVRKLLSEAKKSQE